MKTMKYDYKKKHKVGDIIYPNENETDGILNKSIWSVVTEINNKGNWKNIKHWESYETAKLCSMIVELLQTCSKTTEGGK